MSIYSAQPARNNLFLSIGFISFRGRREPGRHCTFVLRRKFARTHSCRLIITYFNEFTVLDKLNWSNTVYTRDLSDLNDLREIIPVCYNGFILITIKKKNRSEQPVF